MQRTGRINMPSFRIVVTEHTASPKAGKYVEKVGTYNPKSKERVLDADRIKYWMSVGAKPSATVHNMLVSLGIINAKKVNILPAYKEPAPAVAEGSGETKKEEAPVEAAPAAAPAEAPAEAVPEAARKEEVPAPTEAPVAESTDETAKAE